MRSSSTPSDVVTQTGMRNHISGCHIPIIRTSAAVLPDDTLLHSNAMTEAYFASMSEICNPDPPHYSLAPSPFITKEWYNDVVYIPDGAIQSGPERHFKDRFVQGPNGTWIDSSQARATTNKFKSELERHRRKALKAELRNKGADNFQYWYGSSSDAGRAAKKPQYLDAYSGEYFMEHNGQLLTKQQHSKVAGDESSESSSILCYLSDMFDSFGSGADIDNLRAPCTSLLSPPIKNKEVSADLFHSFKRSSKQRSTDKQQGILELPRSYIGEDVYYCGRIAALGENAQHQCAGTLPLHVQSAVQ